MSFSLVYNLIKDNYDKFREIESPFTTPDIAINYAYGKDLVCIPHDYMTDDKLKENLIFWLDHAKKKNYKTVALTGVRDSSKIGIADISSCKVNDDNRVKFIVEVLIDWLKQNGGIEEILLIAMSNDFTRNFDKPINVV